MENSIIKLEHVSCKVGRKYLLNDISWNVKKGEHWLVFGMNGSGKTTLLSIVSGFKHFSSGKVSAFGESFTNENILHMRQRIGWVSMSFFDKHYSKESALNIVLSGKNGTLGLSYDIKLEDVRFAKTLLEKLSLGDRVDYTFDMFSKGERQNILIARALFCNPDILVLDEPCTGLDVYNRTTLFNTIEDLSERSDVTIIYVTHYVEEIMPLFQNTLLLKNGRIFRSGKTSDLFIKEIITELLGFPIQISKDNNNIYLQVETRATLTDLMI